MHIHDDASMDTVVGETVSALNDAARHIGKADRSITPAQIEEVEAAIAQLRSALHLKMSINASRT